MKLFFTSAFVLALTGASAQIANNNSGNNSSVPVFARVDASGLSANGTGIRGVTYTNLTQNTTAIVQGFFSAGGIGPQPNGQAPAATARPVSGTVLVNNGMRGLLDYRSQLTVERMRLVQLIESKRSNRQSSAVETAQVMAIERAIQQADRQLALRGFKEPQVPGQRPR